MRILYDNIVDSLSAASIIGSSEVGNFSIQNIKGDRLESIWRSSSATTQSITFNLPMIPNFPDNTSGITYYVYSWTTVDGWSAAASSCTLTVESNYLKAAGNGSGNRIIISKSIGVGLTSKTIIFSLPYDADITDIRISSDGGATSSPTNYRESGNHYIASTVFGGTSTTAILYIYYASAAIQGTKSVYFHGIYIGSGSYTSKLTDKSLCSNDANMYSTIPINGDENYLMFNGYSSYIIRSSLHSNITMTKVMRIKLRPPVDSSHNPRIYVQGGVDYAFYDYSSSSIAFFTYKDGSNRTGTLITRSLLEDSQWHVLVVITDGSTMPGNKLVYIDGVLIADTTGSVSTGDWSSIAVDTDIYIGAASTSNTQAFMDMSFFYAYNRRLTASEIYNISNGIKFSTEEVGLVAKYNIDQDYGINSIAILGHNIRKGASIMVYADFDSNFFNPPVSIRMNNNDDIILYFDSVKNYYHYWKFVFSGQGSLDIGRVWLGEYMQISPSSLDDFSIIKVNTDRKTYGRGRQKFAIKGEMHRKFLLEFPGTNNAMINDIIDLFGAAGKYKSIIFCNFDSIRDYGLVEPCYCSIIGDIAFASKNGGKFSYSLILEEDK